MTWSWSHRPRNAAMGRFGGGWQLAFGFRATRHTLLIELLVGTLTLHFPPKRPEGSVMMTQGEHGVERYDRVASTCPWCGFPARDAAEEMHHMEDAHPEVIAERLRRAGL